MKRAVTGGAHRGPVALRRQKRTIRFVQLLLVLVSAGVTLFAISLRDEGDWTQVVVLVVLSAIGLGAAWSLSDGRDVRIPSPARLDELAGRAERAAIDRAEDQGTTRGS
jgi:hypothetical protein